VMRDSEGAPTGLMIESALWKIVNPLVPEPNASSKRDALLAAQKHCHSLGITAVGSMEYARDVREILLPMANQLTIRCAVTLLDRGWPMDFAEAHELAIAAGDRLSVIGLKAFADGTLGSRTARMLEDYCDDPGNRGMLVELAAEGTLHKWAHDVAREGFSPAIHAIGDHAVRLALNAFECLPEGITGRIEHAQQVHPSDLARFPRVIASMQPLHKADDGRYAVQRLGPERIQGFFPFRQLLKYHAKLAFGSDWPVVSCDPVAGIRAAITGLTLDGQLVRPEENLRTDEALFAYTAGSARALRMENAGVLAESASADLIMFDRDPFTADWIAAPPRVILTMARGEIVYRDEKELLQPEHVKETVTSR
jgi:predicted amidohydrolase YtcJ